MAYIKSKGEQATTVLQLYENALTNQLDGGAGGGGAAPHDIDDDGSALFW